MFRIVAAAMPMLILGTDVLTGNTLVPISLALGIFVTGVGIAFRAGRRSKGIEDDIAEIKKVVCGLPCKRDDCPREERNERRKS